jgi:plastocyanin
MQAVLSWFLVATTALLMTNHNGGEEDKKDASNKSATAPGPYVSSYAATNVLSGGSIAGTVTYSGKAPAPKKLAVTKDTQVCGKAEHMDESLVVGANGGVKNVVVSIKGIKAGKGLETMGASFVLDQKGCMYTPHVSLVPVNATLKILNPDGILHNIHTYSQKNPAFNKSQPQFKKEMTATFAQPEVITAKCDVHGWMSASIVVVDHPYYVITDASGAYKLTDVPPGTYTVEFWQEKLGTKTAQVTVAAGQAAALNFAYPAATN